MTQRCIILPNGRPCSVGTYTKAWRTLLGLPADAQIRGWDHFPESAERVLHDLRFGLHDRINRHIPGFGHGRKWSGDWQRAARHCANEVNHPRLIVRWVPPDLRSRLAHRIHQED